MHITEAKRVHLVGVKGVAMTALALCLQDLGIEVSGSDVEQAFVTDAILHKRHVAVSIGFSQDHVSSQNDLVVYTGAHQGEGNIEVKRAKELGIRVISHAQALGELTDKKRLVSVCGAGGKSTTSAMLAWILEKSGLSPSFSVGVGNIPNLGVPGKFVSDSAWFVAEADEYAVDPTTDTRPRFVFQKPEIIICTNLKYDHPDIYPSFLKTKEVFLQFFNTLPDTGKLIINGDDEELLSLVPKLTTKATVVSVGMGKQNDVRILDIKSSKGMNMCGVSTTSELQIGSGYSTLLLHIPGEFNLKNASMALTASTFCGASPNKALDALASFAGTIRRFEYKGIINGAPWYDDYAHTPEEIRSTLKAVREWYPDKKIIAIFQPHTYSRTKALFDGFSRSFTDADEVILIDIFASAREAFDPNVTSEKLVDAILKTRTVSNVKSMKSKKDIARYLASNLSDTHVVMTLGAGDVYEIYTMMGDI